MDNEQVHGYLLDVCSISRASPVDNEQAHGSAWRRLTLPSSFVPRQLSRLTAICLGRVSISASEGGGGLRGAVLSLTPHDLQIETQTGVCAYCFLVLSSRNEYIPDGPVNDAEWAAHQVPLTLSSILLTFCNIHRPRSPSSPSSSSTSLPVSISHSF